MEPTFLNNICEEHEYILTFGHGHNPGTGYFVRIKAPNYEAAGAAAVKRFRLKWCQLYKDEESAGVKEWNLKDWDQQPTKPGRVT